jgi:hypothetical protein
VKPTAYPLHWPAGVARERTAKRSRFGAWTLARARDAVLRQVKLMGADHRTVVLSTNAPLRLDGKIYADAPNPADPGAAVYFHRRTRPYVIACDAFRKLVDNLVAIAKAVEALRGIERWGASSLSEQAYSAFHALPPAAGTQGQAKHWRDVLGVPASLTGADALMFAEMKWRKAIAAEHPDKGGDVERAADLNGAIARAREELR